MAAKKKFRSYHWFGEPGIDSMVHRSWMKNQGLPQHLFDGRPVIGICNTWSELTPCNAHFREIAERVKRGVLEAGGFPLEFPVMALGEPVMRPTAMLFRNLAAMDVEESIRANPLDGVILLTGCDKTTPALMMGAASCDVPALVVSGGPMLNGRWRDQTIGSGTHVWKFKEMLKTGEMNDADLMEDFYYAGGLPVVLRELGKAGLLHKNALTVNGDTIWNNVKAAKNWNPKVIFPIEKPFKKQGGIAVLRGNLVPKGAVIKPSAATPKLMKHRGRGRTASAGAGRRHDRDRCAEAQTASGRVGRRTGETPQAVEGAEADGGSWLRQDLHRPREPGRRRRRPGFSGWWQRDAAIAGVSLIARSQVKRKVMRASADPDDKRLTAASLHSMICGVSLS